MSKQLRSISPIRYPKEKKALKRHIDAPSPERIVTENREHKKKRCTKPVWKTTTTAAAAVPGEEGEEEESAENIYQKLKNDLQEIKERVKLEPEELLPYAIKPIQSVVYTKEKKAKRSTHKKRKVRAGAAEVCESGARAALDIPVLGLSTYKVRGGQLIAKAIDAALECGYRLFDTSAQCQNERDLGAAFLQLLPKHGLRREDIYIISKLDPCCMTYEDAMESAETTLQDLGTDYVDVILLFWPNANQYDYGSSENAMMECYRALEDLHAARKVKELGVYKFNVEQLTYLLRRCCVVPAMLQAEFHPYLYQRSLVDLCRVNSIRMQAFCFIRVMQDPVINELASKYCKAPAQIILRWIVQHGVGVLPKSKTPSHIRENANIFDFSLDPSDMELINSLNQDRRFTPHHTRN